MRWYIAAAVLIAALGSAGYLYWQSRQPASLAYDHLPVIQDTSAYRDDVILTLADGTHLLPDSTAAGIIIKQEQTTILKSGDHWLTYQAPETAGSSSAAGYNTITTPRGRQYRLSLPDGTQVWLNAASSLQFPTAFNGSQRKVELKGEAYFEVAHDAAKPFLVNFPAPGKRDQQGAVKVLGTHFNIMAYPGETTAKATLLEGSVQVTTEGQTVQPVTLQPGQQAQLDQSDHLQVHRVNTDAVIAWKKGELILNDVSMEEAAVLIGRWHNVRFVFTNPHLKNCRFTISFLRGETINEMMDVISQYNGFDYQIKNHIVTLSGAGCR